MIENLIDNILERRIVDNGRHKIELIIKEDEFSNFYDDLDGESAQDMVRTYLEEKADDGIPHDIDYKSDNNGIIKVFANLQYIGDDPCESRNN